MSIPNCNLEHQLDFNNNGYLLIKNFFDPDSCLSICKAIETLDPSPIKSISSSRSTFIECQDQSCVEYSGLTYLQKASLFVPEINGLKSLQLLEFSAALLGVDDVFFMEDEIHIRQAMSKHEIPAHQDNFYFALQNPVALTCYVYLTRQERKSGGLGFLPNKTSSPTNEHDPSTTLGFSSYNKDIECSRKEDFNYPSTSPGDVIFHHSNTYHRAYSNSTSISTASLSIRVFSNSNLLKSQSIQRKYSANLLVNRAKDR